MLICGDTRYVPGCFNSCHQRIHSFIVPVIPVLCFTKSYLDFVNKKISVQFGFLLSPWQLTLCLPSTSSLESTNHSSSPYFLAPHLPQGHPIPLPLTSPRTKYTTPPLSPSDSLTSFCSTSSNHDEFSPEFPELIHM